MNTCICEGNWRILVAEYQNKFGTTYVDSLGNEWRFYGLVWSEDDFYYGMSGINNNTKNHILLSCVGHIEDFGYIEISNTQ